MEVAEYLESNSKIYTGTHLKQCSEDIHNLTHLDNYIRSIYLVCKSGS